MTAELSKAVRDLNNKIESLRRDLEREVSAREASDKRLSSEITRIGQRLMDLHAGDEPLAEQVNTITEKVDDLRTLIFGQAEIGFNGLKVDFQQMAESIELLMEEKRVRETRERYMRWMLSFLGLTNLSGLLTFLGLIFFIVQGGGV